MADKVTWICLEQIVKEKTEMGTQQYMAQTISKEIGKHFIKGLWSCTTS